MQHNKIYLFTFGAVFAIIAIVFDFFPRSTFSPLEKRQLDSVPEFSIERLFDGEYTRSVSHWFSDSEPFRDDLLTFAMGLKDAAGISVGGDEEVSFQAVEDAVEEKPDDNRDIADYQNNINAGEMAKVAMKGIIIVGSGPNVRALMAYGGGPEGGTCYANVANLYKKTFGPKVNVYSMAIPTATEFYCPTKAEGRTKKQLPTIRNIYSHLDPEVKAVDIYSSLAAHVKEDIYLRTDHHWAPLGAYYAAQQFAKVAGVPFRDLKSYTRHVIHGYVGSMYGYSRDISVKKAPEDFVFYKPKDSLYSTTIISYRADANFRITSESKPMASKFFYSFKDGSGSAYCTFMGGDSQLTVVRTGVKNGRRLMILKDSFGNALPGYLFYSFEEIHVVDFRYCNKNLKEYVPANKITDILFAFNIYNAYAPASCNRLANFLTQKAGAVAPADAKGKNVAPASPATGQKATDPKAAKAEKSAATKNTADPAAPMTPATPTESKPTAPPAAPQKVESVPVESTPKPVKVEPVKVSSEADN